MLAKIRSASLRTRYVAALTAVALLSLIGQLLIQRSLRQNEADGHIINVAGRQRMLSQRLSKLALALTATDDAGERTRRSGEMREALETWERSHLGLQHGDAELGLPRQNSSTVQEMFRRIEPSHRAMLFAAKELLRESEAAPAAGGGEEERRGISKLRRRFAAQVLAEETAFLTGMERIVAEYDRAARRRVDLLKSIELALLATTLAVLLIEGWFVFRPADARIKQMFADLDRSQTELRRRSDSLRLQQTIGTATNKAATLEEAIATCLREVCRHMRWEVGHAYLLDEGGTGELVSSKLWHLDDPQKFDVFRRISENFRFTRGIGLPGRVLESGRPLWIMDVQRDKNFPRNKQARDIGVHAGFAFPLIVGAETVGVLEFFSPRAIEPDTAILEVMAHLGTQFGRAVERDRAERQLSHQAYHDALTNLPNRALFVELLQHTIKRASRGDSRVLFAVLFLDVDRFKVINDSLGHTEGDQLLIHLARRIQNCVRPGDTVARLGGDEFTILLDNLGDPSDALRIAGRINEELSSPFVLGGRDVFTSVSIGVALSDGNYTSPHDMLRDADTAMYRAKIGGKARYEVFSSEMLAAANARLDIETELRRAVERDEFFLNFQPIVRLADGALVGFESLVRWQHPTRGVVPPIEFIELMEETGLIVPVGEWVLTESCRQLREWQTTHPPAADLTISVNLSPKQLSQANLIDTVARVVGETGLDARRLRLEITESSVLDDSRQTIAVLEDLRALGAELSIDDFGTGYSSLSYLHRLPLNNLKIDRSFVSRMTADGENAEIVRAIVALAHNLQLKVVAEGIEDEAQAARLQGFGCEYGQGYFFSKPVRAEEARRMVTALSAANGSPPGDFAVPHPAYDDLKLIG